LPSGNCLRTKAVTEVKKCDPSICPEHTAAAVKEMKDCDPAACPEHIAASKEIKPCCPEAIKTTATK
jgi:hypothetical protein